MPRPLGRPCPPTPMPYYHVSPDRRELTEVNFRRGLWCIVGQYEKDTNTAKIRRSNEGKTLHWMILRLIPLPKIRSRDRARFGPLALPEFASLLQTSLSPTRGEMYKRCYPKADNFVPSGLDQTTRPWSEHHQRTGFTPPPSGFACGRSVLPGRPHSPEWPMATAAMAWV
jgi:hypothetical protein